MPVYEYGCARCGVFDAVRPLARFREPAECPGCGALSGRVLASAPALGVLGQAIKRAHALNERSADAPRSTRAGHGMGCGCCSSSPRPSKTRQSADGAKSMAGARPWMISH